MKARPLLLSLCCGLAAGWQVPPIRGGSHRSSCTASSCLRHPAVRAVEPDEAHAAADGGGTGGGEEEVRQQGIGIINRIRRRRRTLAEKSAAKGVVEGVAKDVASLGLLEGVAKDVDMAIAQRRRRLNVKLGTSLKTFKQELLDEVSLQVAATKERRQLVAERREAASRDIASSFDALRSDLNDEIEEALAGVQRGGRTLERALRQMRDTWEAELAELVKEAEAELDLAADEIEDLLEARKEVCAMGEQITPDHTRSHQINPRARWPLVTHDTTLPAPSPHPRMRSFDSWGLPLMTLMTSLMTSLDCLPHQAWTRSFDSWEDKWREQGRRVLPTAASRFGGAC